MDIMTPSVRQRVECRFCSLLSGAQDVFDSIWMSDDRYRAVISVGAMVPGWSLLCPVDHSVNLSAEYEMRSFWTFASASSHVLKDMYGACAFFEHGAGSEDSLTGCGVGHAHGHLVPLAFSLEKESRRAAPELKWTRCLASEVKALAADREYLFVASEFAGEMTSGSLCILKEPTSQFFRRVIARKLGISDMFDYKKNPMLDIASQSAWELRALAGSSLVGS